MESVAIAYRSNDNDFDSGKENTDELILFRKGAALAQLSVTTTPLRYEKIKNEIHGFQQKYESVSQKTVRAAKKIVGLLQSYESIPDVSVGPHGEIDFDWMESKDWSLTMSVCPNGEVAFAGIFDIKGSQVHDENYRLPLEVIAYLEAFDKTKTINE